MKFTFLILLLFAKSCQSQDVDNNTTKTETNNKVLVEYQKPIKGYNAKIYWTVKDSASEATYRIIGPAILELERQSDKQKFKVNYESYSISDSVCSLKIYQTFKEKNIPNVLQVNYSTENRPDFYFKDMNFDGIEELIITETGLLDYDRALFKVYEFQNDKLIELKNFPRTSLLAGNIDYDKKEVTAIDYYNCCEYDEDFYRYENKNQFIYYKTLHHKVDPDTEDEEITVKEKGKPDVKIFKKK